MEYPLRSRPPKNSEAGRGPYDPNMDMPRQKSKRDICVDCHSVAPAVEGRERPMRSLWPLVTDGPFIETRELLGG